MDVHSIQLTQLHKLTAQARLRLIENWLWRLKLKNIDRTIKPSARHMVWGPRPHVHVHMIRIEYIFVVLSTAWPCV